MVRKNLSGLTLIEIIIAFAMLSIVLVAFLTMFSGGLSFIFFSGDRAEANNNAQSIMDRIYNEVDTTDLNNSIDQIIESIVGAGNYLDCTGNLTLYDQSLTSTSTVVVKYYVEDKNLLINTGTDHAYEIHLKVYYNNGSKFVVLTSPLI